MPTMKMLVCGTGLLMILGMINSCVELSTSAITREQRRSISNAPFSRMIFFYIDGLGVDDLKESSPHGDFAALNHMAISKSSLLCPNPLRTPRFSYEMFRRALPPKDWGTISNSSKEREGGGGRTLRGQSDPVSPNVARDLRGTGFDFWEELSLKTRRPTYLFAETKAQRDAIDPHHQSLWRELPRISAPGTPKECREWQVASQNAFAGFLRVEKKWSAIRLYLPDASMPDTCRKSRGTLIQDWIEKVMAMLENAYGEERVGIALFSSGRGGHLPFQSGSPPLMSTALENALRAHRLKPEGQKTGDVLTLTWKHISHDQLSRAAFIVKENLPHGQIYLKKKAGERYFYLLFTRGPRKAWVNTSTTEKTDENRSSMEEALNLMATRDSPDIVAAPQDYSFDNEVPLWVVTFPLGADIRFQGIPPNLPCWKLSSALISWVGSRQ